MSHKLLTRICSPYVSVREQEDKGNKGRSFRGLPLQKSNFLVIGKARWLLAVRI